MELVRVRGWLCVAVEFRPCAWLRADAVQRSLFGLVHCYNRLPPQVVAAKSVKTFQRRLQWGLQQCANNGVAEWQLLYSNLWRQMPLVRLDALFSS